MALLEDRTAVFIVRVWCERGEAEAAVAEWRGSVEHVQSGQRAFFRHLESVVEFMKPHLEGIGIDAQQRFWERISSVINDVGGTPIELALDARAPAIERRDVAASSISERKRR
ncbi:MULTISPECIES: hypothetical protein [unclassified Lysobacter]|uniref:hypothetical protein n=1 Tax=unclassified Lysobacter TaxID=2635362 RepID=UPI0006F53980|nr:MULTISPECIES: hypothetical protein [unclassified Lysobacter]KQZ59632.1 hypothetical protein ASD53_05345 [Lysobacter sp. Root559]KRA75884.1 hypothetical protein ASD78_07955 [Lysobacter sp. Root667]KRC36683.1 hypothetical protein ASE10_06120 [Lysobacter sp. Root76]KRD66779.1 hypothetical protein ASE45_15775 [Lysobacter sp. Root96]